MRTSLLTQGLDGLASVSKEVKRLLQELYALDDELQDAHMQAKRDEEFGERVVTAYTNFLAHRDVLIAALEKAKTQVPWQLRMKIDDLELTLHQRKVMASPEYKKAKQETNAEVEPPAADENEDKKTPSDPAARTQEAGAAIAPWIAISVLALVLAILSDLASMCWLARIGHRLTKPTRTRWWEHRRAAASVSASVSRTMTETTHSESAAMIGNLCNLGLARDAAWNVLIVGDGNFSYSRAFLRANRERIAAPVNAINVTATSLDTRDELISMYPKCVDILTELEAGGVNVVHDINATRLIQYSLVSTQKFDRIVFNFPHFAEGGNRRNKIHRHRQLLCDFFLSARDVLAADGQVWVSLCAGQGGTPMEKKVRAWGDTWQVMHCAASAGLLVQNVHECPVDELLALGYYSVGYQLRERPFWTVDALTHVFCGEDLGLPAHFPLEWTRDVSFWFNNEFDEDKLLAIIRQHVPSAISFTVELFDEYKCPTTLRSAASYHIHLSSTRVALTKEYVNSLAIAILKDIEASSFAQSRGS
ncbi:TPA: hypothetical protein N0F65_010991 [Lagenidium giganteum]|uniref:25S rRNA (uridine-N(3))-methyltransferase BMT5-like domain-containing protein n=1 Tax=Lagenidium giganteum TaxID=4803 RepID=A0AAV2ZAV8_9STRA|nr:TPA: hypothetical protein N0F65_010991 [Lagenidium giganteum]